MAITTRRIVGRFEDPTTQPTPGYVTFTPEQIIGSGRTIIAPLSVRADLDATGSFILTLALDDGPAGSGYLVQWYLGAAAERVRVYSMRLLPGTGDVNLFDLSPAVSGNAGSPPVTATGPIAALTVTPTGSTVAASAAGSTVGGSPIASAAWDWGDGITTPAGPSLTASHTYASAGTYTVTVTVRDSAGALDNATAQVTASTAPAAPVLTVTAGVNSAAVAWRPIGTGGSPLTALLLERRPSGGAWATVATVALTATGYADPGVVYPTSYGYRLTATNANGSATSVEVTVIPASPGAPLTARMGTVVSDLSVVGDASGSTGPNPIASYGWSWGDNTSSAPSSAASRSHTYTAAGTYTVTVTVADSTGVTSVASAPVTVAPAAAMGTTFTPAYPPSY